MARAASDVRHFSPRQGHHLFWLIPRLRLSTSTASEAVRAARPDCIQRPRVFFFGLQETAEKQGRGRCVNKQEVFAFRRNEEAGHQERAREACAHWGHGELLCLKHAWRLRLQREQISKGKTKLFRRRPLCIVRVQECTLRFSSCGRSAAPNANASFIYLKRKENFAWNPTAPSWH